MSDPVAMANILKDGKRPLLVVGSQSLETKVGDKTQLEVLLALAKALECPVVATGHVHKAIVESGFPAEKVTIFNVMNLTDRLKDHGWKGLDGEGPYDVVVFGGHLVYHLAQMLSTLINFAYDVPLKTVCLDPYHQPNARFFLPNLDAGDYRAYLEALLQNL